MAGFMEMLLLQSRTSIRSHLRSGAVFPINGRMREELLKDSLFLASTMLAPRHLAYQKPPRL